MLEDVFEQNVLISPWPVYVGDKFFDGSKVPMANSCGAECIKEAEAKDHHVCGHGLSHISKIIEGTKVVVSGVYISNSSESRKSTKKHKPRRASLSHIYKWMLDVEGKYKAINKISNRIAKNKFDQFHEFAKWANEIHFYSSRLVSKSKNCQDTGFNAANDDLKSLHKISVMLLDSLDTSSIYFNPSSASFGSKRQTDVYSLVHKISLVLSHSKVNKSKIRISINGNVKNKHRVYESFKIIPLSFIQNALKYRRSSDVEVVFEELEEKLIMRVVSYGDHIPEEEVIRLFERGYRASSALRRRLEGSGLGLYVAKIVADAHGFNVAAESSMFDKDKNIAKNTFTVFIC